MLAGGNRSTPINLIASASVTHFLMANIAVPGTTGENIKYDLIHAKTLLLQPSEEYNTMEELRITFIIGFLTTVAPLR